MKETNETNTLETQLRSWRPRRPSAGFERRLFRHAKEAPRLGRVAGWLAPAAACLVFAGLVLNPRMTATFPATEPAGGMLAQIMSNQSYAAYLPGSFQRVHNQLETFPKPTGEVFFSFTNLTR